MAIDAEILDRLAEAADKAADETRTVYLTFGAFGLYYMVTVGATTHEQLLAGGTIKMPVLDVSLPLVGFFVIVPILFVLLHVNLLLQLRVLARKLYDYLQALGDADPAETSLRRKLMHPFVLCQLLAGPTGGRFDRIAMRAVLEVPIVWLPLAALVFTQLRFLPYHSEGITWLHRLLISLDVFLLWFLWPRILRKYEKPVGDADPVALAHDEEELTDVAPPGAMSRARAALARVSLVIPTLGVLVLLLSYGVATIPDEWLERKLVGARSVDVAVSYGSTCYPADSWLPPLFGVIELRDSGVPSGRTARRMLCSTYLLLERPSPYLSLKRNLDLRVSAPLLSALLPNQSDGTRPPGALNLGGRDLRYSDFTDRDLTGANLSGANLTGATLTNARLSNVNARDVMLSDQPVCAGEKMYLTRGSWLRVPPSACRTFDDPTVPDAPGNCVSFCRAVFNDSNLGGAKLDQAGLRNAMMERANFAYATMPGADLGQAELTGANMPDVDLAGAMLEKAQLSGVRLSNAQLQGARMSNADLVDSRIDGADMRGADLASAQMQGADLKNAKLDGANLAGACLDKASMPGASLFGTSLRRASLAGVAGLGGTQTPADLTLADLSAATGMPEASASDGEEPAAPSDEFIQARFTDMMCQEQWGNVVTKLLAQRLISDAGNGGSLGSLQQMLVRTLIGLRPEQCPGAAGLTPVTIRELQRLASRTVAAGEPSAATPAIPTDCTMPEAPPG